MDNDNVPVATPTDTEETVETPAPDAAEVDVVKLQETNKKLFERAKKAEEIARTLKAKVPQPLSTPKPTELPDEIVTDVKELKLAERKRQFGYQNSLSPSETDLLFRMAGDRKPDEVVKDQDFKDLLEVRRSREKVANAIPSSSNRTVRVGGKTFAEMTPEEREKNWADVIKRK